MWTLIIVLLATTLQNPKPHTIKVYLPYFTQYTCEGAQDQVDADAIKTSFKASRRGSVKQVTTFCERHKIVEPNRECSWNIECSNTIQLSEGPTPTYV